MDQTTTGSSSGSGSLRATPYDLIIDITKSQVYRTPTKGFEARMIVLATINVLLILASITYLAVTQYEKQISTRRSSDASYRQNQRSFWLFRRVDRTSGKLIIPNHRVLGTAFAILVALTWIGATVDAIQVFVYKGSMKNSFGWRAFVLMPMFGHGWITVWTSLTTFLMTVDRHSSFTVSSTLINVFFIACGVGGTALAIISSSINLVKGLQFWQKYLDLLKTLEHDAAMYPNLPSNAYKVAMNQAAGVQLAAIEYFRSGTYTFGPCIILPLAILVVNIGGLCLCGVLKKQIDYNKEQLLPSMTTDHFFTTSLMRDAGLQRPSLAATKTSKPFNPATPFETDYPMSSKSLTASEIRRMSTTDSRNHFRDKARTIVILTRARWELLIFSVNAGVISTFIVGTLIYLAVVCNNLTIVTGPFGIFESAVYQGGWYYSTLMLVASIILIVQAYLYRDRSAGIGGVGTTYTVPISGTMGTGPTTSMMSTTTTTRPSASRSCSFALPPPASPTISSQETDEKRSSALLKKFTNPWSHRGGSADEPPRKVLEVNMVVEQSVEEESVDEISEATNQEMEKHHEMV